MGKRRHPLLDREGIETPCDARAVPRRESRVSRRAGKEWRKHLRVLRHGTPINLHLLWNRDLAALRLRRTGEQTGREG
jgi:hypothetical protein